MVKENLALWSRIRDLEEDVIESGKTIKSLQEDVNALIIARNKAEKATIENLINDLKTQYKSIRTPK